MIWILFLLGAIQQSESKNNCKISDQNLSLDRGIGNIHPDGYPYSFSRNQYCEWTFPNDKYQSQGLLLFIVKMKLIKEEGRREFAGDITIRKEIFSEIPAANCRFYGKNVSDIDVHKLTAYVTTYHEEYNRYCTAWFIDSQKPTGIVFRAHNVTTKAQSEITFYVKYNYVDVSLERTNIADASPATAANTQSLSGTAVSNPPETTENRTCAANQTYVLVLIIVCVMLLAAMPIVGLLMRRKYISKIKAASANESTNDTVVTYSTNADLSPYATVAATGEERKDSGPCSPYDTGSNQQCANHEMYDVPKNNRLRTVTVQSSHSVLSEEHYQVPPSMATIQETAEETQTSSGQIRDVYAVVNKAKN